LITSFQSPRPVSFTPKRKSAAEAAE